MHTVIETAAYLRAARNCGISDEEMAAIVNVIANNPMAGDAIEGAGGCRKIRIAGRGKGKSGGYRLVTFYSGMTIPVFLLTVLSKGERANISKAERNDLRDLTKELVESYARKITPKAR